MKKGMEALIQRLRNAPEYQNQVVHYRYLPPVAAQLTAMEEVLPPRLRPGVQALGIRELYTHQAEAITRLRQGQHLGITTPTASGKTLIYNLAVLEKLLADPEAHALYLFPLKALAQDQLKTLREFFRMSQAVDLDAEVYDGDTPAKMRAQIKRCPPRVIITNPDMLHYGMLAYPQGWMKFFRSLRLIVIDEAHTYRGVFGSNVALILRRLRRLCQAPGPTLVASSATMANAHEFLNLLTGLDFHVLSESGAPRQGRHVVLVNPLGSPYTQAAGLLQECLDHDIKTIVFTQSRKITELIHIWITQSSPRDAGRVAAYRSGYLPEERRRIEQRLFHDELSAVISTSALEAGIDVGGLDACILVGYPGTMISTWQRVGRAGRQDREALMVLVAMPDALDQYLLRYPESFFGASFENCILDPANAQLVKRHLPCAAQEEPLQAGDAAWLGDAAWAYVPEVVRENELKENAAGDRWFSSRRYPHRRLDIRSVGEQYVIHNESSDTVLGSIDASRAFKECHPGAIYLHAGIQYEVVGVSEAQHSIQVRESDADWYTQYTSSEEIEILDGRVRASAREAQAGGVRVRVTEKIVAYERHRIRDQSLISEHKLDLPPRIYETHAVLITIPDDWRRQCLNRGTDFGGGLHAAEHALIATLPVHVLCDRWDLGGLSALAHPQVDQAALFVYDGFPGGVGLTTKALEVLNAWLHTAKDMVMACGCEEGCPACIHSPKCGSRNHPLDKTACQLLLNALTDVPPQPHRFVVAPRQPEPSPLPPGSRESGRKLKWVVFDLETQRSAAEVGGWENADRMKMSVGVVYDCEQRAYFTYREDRVNELIQHLLAADRVVGFNIDRFDLLVLSAYSTHVDRIRTLDMAKETFAVLGHRISLDHLAQHTLGRNKTADGLQALAWFQTGEWTPLEAYCQADVEITRDLFAFGWQHGYLLFERQGEIMKIPMDWKQRFPEWGS